MRTLKFVFTGGAVHAGATLLEHNPVNSSLKSPGSAKPSSGSAYKL
jgi:hypothetical protein